MSLSFYHNFKCLNKFAKTPSVLSGFRCCHIGHDLPDFRILRFRDNGGGR